MTSHIIALLRQKDDFLKQVLKYLSDCAKIALQSNIPRKGAVFLNEIDVDAYFYMKLEQNTTERFDNGYCRWFMEYFKEPVHVRDANGNDITAEPCSVYIVPPDTPMYFIYDNIDSFIHSAWIFDADRKFMDSLNIPYRTPVMIKRTGDFERLLFEMNERSISDSDLRDLSRNLYMMLILTFVHDELLGFGKQYDIKRGEDIATIRATIMNSTATPWTVKSMARLANMSVSTFNRQYKKLYGTTPIADLYDMRFRKAKLLLETGYSIPWILNSCCFGSPQHFSHFFKAREGISPTEWLSRKKTK